MASAFNLLIVSAIIVLCSGQAQAIRSKHSTDVIDAVLGAIKGDVKKACFDKMNTTLDALADDKNVTDFYRKINAKTTTKATFPKLINCTDSEYKAFKKNFVTKYMKSNNAFGQRQLNYATVYKGLSKKCQAKAHDGLQYTSWLIFEQTCEKIRTSQKAAYKAACSGDDYGDLKQVVCNSASAILSGLVTMGLCLVASLFNKL